MESVVLQPDATAIVKKKFYMLEHILTDSLMLKSVD